MAGMGPTTTWPLATPGKALPELLFACFQMTFAAVATALVIGALVERVRFSAILAFAVLFLPVRAQRPPSLALASVRTASATKPSPVALSRFLAGYHPCRLAAERDRHRASRGARVLED